MTTEPTTENATPTAEAGASDIQGQGQQPATKPKRVKPLSRPQRWAKAAADASQALQELVDIQQEFSDWNDNLNDNLRSSALGEKLQAVVDLDIQGAMDTVNEAENIDLPLGFGRD